MTAYWVARARITDPAAYKRYADAAGDIVRAHGGRFLARGGDYEVVEGTDHFERFVVAEFPSLERARACHASPAYQEAARHRREGGGEAEIIIVEGC